MVNIETANKIFKNLIRGFVLDRHFDRREKSPSIFRRRC